jgi:queuine tRNA-ribosyltransferase
LELPHGQLPLPTFLPDATLGVVRAVDSADIEAAGIDALVMNTFHLMQQPGTSTIQALGGLHGMTGWRGPILTDSGGFQAYSLIREQPRLGALTDNGIVVQPEGMSRKLQLTPEKCIQLQISYGADIVMCLDDCTHVDDPPAVQELSVRRTIAWAKRCRVEFDRLLAQKRKLERAPLLFAVVQGGASEKLRTRCAEALLEIGFDGYGYGGWPLDADGNLVTEMLDLTRRLIPARYPLHGLGVGHPLNVVAAAAMSYQTFDSALPTRDARRGRLYTFTRALPLPDGRGSDSIVPCPSPLTPDKSWFRFLYITDDKYIKDARPVEEGCDCFTCRRYSRGYLRHLYRANEATFQRLATIHNLRFMARLTEALRHG